MSLETLSFSKAFKDVTGGNHKVKTNEYLSEGKFPIVDQGKELIAGYVDNMEMLCKATNPSIIFGDHTKIIKFIDFDFVLGADGVKVLQPCEKLYPKYAYHYLKTIKFPEKTGYMRHFKYLKLAKIPIPPLDEQKRIAAILDKADEIERSSHIVSQKRTELISSIFYEMFGDPIVNTLDWPVYAMSEICETTQGIQISRSEQIEHETSGYIRYLYISDFKNDENLKFVCDDYPHKLVSKQDLIVANTGTPGAVFFGKTGVLSNNLFKVSFDPSLIEQFYFYHFLNSSAFQIHLQSQMKQGIQRHLGHKTFAKQSIMVPPIELQKRFKDTVDFVTGLSDCITLANENFNALTQELLT